VACQTRPNPSALEGASLFIHHHPNEEKDAKSTKEYISKVAPNAKVELYAADLRTEDECLKLVEAAKKWSQGVIHVLYVWTVSSNTE